MTEDAGLDVTYFSRLDAAECWALLSEVELGRVAWQGDDGIVVLPVNFRLVDHAIVFQTAPGSLLSRLAEPTEVAFQADEIDTESAVGWTVLVQGTTRTASAEDADPVSWLDGDRPVWVAIDEGAVSGRVMSGTKRS